MCRDQRNSQGFTLVELLVVIAIISILGAILFPVFAQAREKARQVSCISHERQIGLAILQYVQDNDGRFPDGINPSGGPFWAGEGWAGQCSPYLKNPSLLHCPDDTTVSPGSTDFVVSYGYNLNLVQPGPDPLYGDHGYYTGITPPGCLIGRLNAAQRTVMLFEVSGVTANITDEREGTGPGSVPGRYFSASSNGLDNRLYAHRDVTTGTDNSYATGALGGRPTGPSGQFQPAQGRHLIGSNFLLADGHVKWLRGNSVSSGMAALLPTCNQGNHPPIDGCDDTDQPFYAAGTETNASSISATFSPE